MKKKLLLAGCGYVGRHLMSSLCDDIDIWEIVKTSRSHKDNHIKYSSGHDIVNLSGITHILVSIPPHDITGCPFFKDHAEQLRSKNIWIGYLSSTSVYGNYNGNWIKEDSKLLAKDTIGVSRIAAENDWKTVNANIFRLSGIYGDGRNMVERMCNGNITCTRKEGLVFNRIHIDDICSIILRSIEIEDRNSIYNCADDQPASQEEIMTYISTVLNLKIIIKNYDRNNSNPYIRSFYENNKKVCNEKIKNTLNIKLKYKNYVQGLDKYISQAKSDKTTKL